MCSMVGGAPDSFYDFLIPESKFSRLRCKHKHSRVIVIIISSGWDEVLCGMLHEARVRISENVTSDRKKAGSNYSGETGCACQKPEMFVCSETLNLPGGQHQTPSGPQGADASKPPQHIQE